MKKNKFKKVAQDVILTEIKSLKKLKTSIDNNFQKVIETIINFKKGKIIGAMNFKPFILQQSQ